MNMKWSKYVFPFKNFNHLLKTTQTSNYYMLSDDKMKAPSYPRELYYSIPITSTFTTLQNYCINAHNLNMNYAHIRPLCVEKMPTTSAAVERDPSNEVRYITNMLRFQSTTSTRSPYTYNSYNTLLPTMTHLNSINSSNIYFTIGDAITTPRTLYHSEIKPVTRYKSNTVQNYLANQYETFSYQTKAPELWTIASSPISLHTTTLVPYIRNTQINAYEDYINDKPTTIITGNLNASDKTDINTTKAYWTLDQPINNNCSSFLSEINNRCSFTKKHTTDNLTSMLSQQVSTNPLTNLPIKTTVPLGTISVPSTISSLLNNITATTFKEETNDSIEKSSNPTNLSISRPIYRRSKINKRLVFKENLKTKDRNSKLSTASTHMGSKEDEKRTFSSSTPSLSPQTTSLTLNKEPGSRVNLLFKNPKRKFPSKTRIRWTPTYEKAHNKVDSNDTSSTIPTVLKSRTHRDEKTNKLRSKANRHSRRTVTQISTTRNVVDLPLPPTTPITTSSTPESAIMRISSINGVKMASIKKNSTNSFINLPNPRNAFTAELPIVTYFKEVTESRKI